MVKLNMTKTRLRALRIIQQRPGLTAQDLAFEITERIRWPQGATRWGAQYVAPLRAAGLVRFESSYVGWVRIYLTEAGRETVLGHG